MPDAGSAATEMTTTAVKRVDKCIIIGRKHEITVGGITKFHPIFARVMENGVGQGIADFIAILDETPRLVIDRSTPAMGVRGIPETDVNFTDMEVAEDMVVIPTSGLKKGLVGLMNAYNAQLVCAGTVTLGIAQRAFEETTNIALDRIQFGRPIA